MNTKKSFIVAAFAMIALVLSWSVDPALAQKDKGLSKAPEQPRKVTQAERQAAADRAKAAGFTIEPMAVAPEEQAAALALPEAGTMQMPMPGAAPRYFSHPNYANSPLPGNIVSEWNAFAQELMQPTPMPGMPMPMTGMSMSKAFVVLAYMQAAVYDAIVAIEGGFAPYNAGILDFANATASREAAVSTAAYLILDNYLKTEVDYATDIKPALDARYADALASIPASTAKDAGIVVGQAAADGIIALRTGDVLSGTGGYVLPPPGPGVWEANVMNGVAVPPMDPWMAQLKPFLRTTADQYNAIYTPSKPNLTDPEYMNNDPSYAADFDEVKAFGGAMSADRTPDMTETAEFWTTNMVIQTNAAYRDLAATRGLNLMDTARLMAMGNMVATDSLIATFSIKYQESFWRPFTAIRDTTKDALGNYSYTPSTTVTWMPAFPTPNFPEFVAGHGSFMSSQAELFTQFFGTNQVEVDLLSTATGTTRHYAFADDIRNEVVDARTWGGMHFRTSTELAVTLGQTLVQDALATTTYFDSAATLGNHAAVSGGIRKFVDGLPGLDVANENNLGQYIPKAVPDSTTYPGSDYYIIELVEYMEKMHSDLPPTKLRGYRQANLPGGVKADPHYLGPAIVAQKDKPVRILFRNLLPTGAGGNLFIPTDTTVMGSGMTPTGHETMDPATMDPQNPMCDAADPDMKAQMVADGLCYAENRAIIHLHGGVSPWISDGTPHQWITPAGETTAYPQGVSVRPVPDMPDSGDLKDGEMTFYYTNQQSARLMFYHDHAWGITRLNVYAGEAAPYIIQDATEKALVDGGVIPGPEATIPLVVQDKTFVPSAAQLAVSDETWDTTNWGGFGSLWLPHVYSPAQNPGDASGVNQFGRWAYGPWFWPPTTSIEYGPIPNPYYDATCDPDVQWCEPPLMPGTPYNSMGMEAFMDTPVVNGTVYPTLTVQPKAYRFRVLNAANDRFFNLSIYKAVDANGVLCDVNNPNPVAESTGVTCTEVALNPAEVAAALEDPTIFPTPLPGTEGPSWIAIGTEGGFLPAPVVIPAQPTTWVNDPTVFNAGNVDQHSLLTAPAERHDVIVDFSQFAGQTLILYNDAPAAFPARDPRYDYYTGNGDYRDTGGAPSTLPGYGPNTRTMMQIKVADAPVQPFDLGKLQTAFTHKADGSGVFESGQHPIIVGQGEYNQAYGTTFQINGPKNGTVQIFDTSLTFETLLSIKTPVDDALTINLKPKMIQDEMGEAFELEYGRMSGFLGVETPNAQAVLQNMILYPYTFPPSEVIKAIDGELAPGVEVAPIASADDGTQIWKITHNGVDTHPIHFHLYDVQLLNRVGWDGIIRKPDLNELGWKDTVRVSPLEDTIVALRPLVPQIPDSWGGLPNSIRLLDPAMPEGEFLMGANTTQREAAGLPLFAFNPDGEPIDIVNHYVNFGWEYVWHCHILSHEEMDMMRPQVVGVAPAAPTGLTFTRAGRGRNQRYDLAWTDNSKNETAFVIERRVAGTIDLWTTVATVESSTLGVVPYIETGVGPGTGTRTYTDRIGNTKTIYEYQVYAINTVGDIWDYSDPAFNEIPAGGGFPTLTLDSRGGSTGGGVSAILAPTNAAATAVVKNKNSATVRVTWADNANNETGFLIQRADDAAFTTGIVNATVGADITAFQETTARATTYYFRVHAFNDTTQSGWSNTATITTP